MNSHKTATRTFGIFFLLAFASYGIGSGLIESVTGINEPIAALQNNNTTLIIGVILIALVHTLVNIGLPVIMVPILKNYNKTMTYGYLSAGIAATVTLIIGAVLIMMLVPLGAKVAEINPADAIHYETIGLILKRGNFYAYQIGMAIWGIGGLMFCYLLFISKLVPKIFAIWGFIGYVIFIAGTVAEMFGFPIGVQLALPGGLFEIALSFWLIFKGFDESKFQQA